MFIHYTIFSIIFNFISIYKNFTLFLIFVILYFPPLIICQHKGTADALNYITHEIYQNLDKSKPMIATFLDLAKAFDTVNHDRLLNKLEPYGIRGKVLLLLKSYLSDSQQNTFEYKTKQVNTNIYLVGCRKEQY